MNENETAVEAKTSASVDQAAGGTARSGPVLRSGGTQKSTVKLAKMAMLTAISIVLVGLIHIPMPAPITFLEYDPADIPIFMGTFAFGPVAGLLITVLVSLIQGFTVSAYTAPYGPLMHIIATGCFVLVAGNIYKRRKTRQGAMIALAAGTVAMVVIMYFANLVITPLYFGMPVQAVKDVMIFILAFNLFKAGVNSVITFLLYKRISAFLHK